jgi:hypothetical protein
VRRRLRDSTAAARATTTAAPAANAHPGRPVEDCAGLSAAASLGAAGVDTGADVLVGAAAFWWGRAGTEERR